MDYEDIAERHALLTGEIQKYANDAPLAVAHPQIMAVTKYQPVDKIRFLLARGHILYGENRVQDAAVHWPALKEEYPQAQLHMIGALQSNKARDAVSLFDVIETLDRPSVITAVNNEASKQNKTMRCMIQVNIGDEPQKSGVSPHALEECVTMCQSLPHITIDGLMCIPPANHAPELYFALMQHWRSVLGLPKLSMGMSGDFAVAIRFGATHVRIGTGLLGERDGR